LHGLFTLKQQCGVFLLANKKNQPIKAGFGAFIMQKIKAERLSILLDTV